MKIMGWKPPQRPEWVKEIMKTPGHTRVQLLLLMILATSSVTSTVSLISRTGEDTSGGSTSHNVESLEVVKAKDELHLKVTGKSTMEVLRNLKKTLNALEEPILKEKF